MALVASSRRTVLTLGILASLATAAWATQEELHGEPPPRPASCGTAFSRRTLLGVGGIAGGGLLLWAGWNQSERVNTPPQQALALSREIPPLTLETPRPGVQLPPDPKRSWYSTWPKEFPRLGRNPGAHFTHAEATFPPHLASVPIGEFVPTLDQSVVRPLSLQALQLFARGELGAQADEVIAALLPRAPFFVNALPGRSTVSLQRVPQHDDDMLLYGPGATNADFLTGLWQRAAIRELFPKRIALPPAAEARGVRGEFHPVGWATRVEVILLEDERILREAIRQHKRSAFRNQDGANALASALAEVQATIWQVRYSREQELGRVRVLSWMLLLERWEDRVDAVTRARWRVAAEKALMDYNRFLATIEANVVVLAEELPLDRQTAELGNRLRGLLSATHAEMYANLVYADWFGRRVHEGAKEPVPTNPEEIIKKVLEKRKP